MIGLSWRKGTNIEGGRRHWAVNYTSTQTFLTRAPRVMGKVKLTEREGTMGYLLNESLILFLFVGLTTFGSLVNLDRLDN